MAATRAGTTGTLQTYATGSGSTGWWAIVMLILIESTVFAGLISSYFYLFSNATVWPPDGIKPPELMIPTIYTVILVASVVPAYVGDRALANGDVRGYKVWHVAGTIMLIVFLAIKIYEYSHLDYTWEDGAYGSIVWTIAGFHSAHVIVVLLKTIVTQALAWMGFFNQRRRSAVQGTTLYWLFVAIAWIPLFATVYLFPNFA